MKILLINFRILLIIINSIMIILQKNSKREIDMAYLQHYGMRTSLVDITENPYIALLFNYQ